MTDMALQNLQMHKVIWGYKDAGFGKLEVMELDGCGNLSDLCLSWIASSCPRLSSLSLSRCESMGHVLGMKALGTIITLRHLDLSYISNVTDSGVEKMLDENHKALQSAQEYSNGNISWLTHLDVTGCSQLSDHSIANVSACVPQIVSLSFGSNAIFTAKAVKSVSRHFEGLLHLSVPNLDMLTDEGVSSICKRCRYLVHLNISRCKRLSGSVTIGMGSLRRLKLLNISHCVNVGNEGFMRVPTWALEKLYAAGLDSLTDAGVHGLLKPYSAVKFPFIRAWDLSGCIQITDTSVDCIFAKTGKGDRGISFLNISGCDEVSPQCLKTHGDENSLCTFLDAVDKEELLRITTAHVQNDLDNALGKSARLRFRGLVSSTASQSQRVQHQFLDDTASQIASAKKLQCLYRCSSSSRLLRRLRRTRQEEQAGAALMLQKVARGRLNRSKTIAEKELKLKMIRRIQHNWRRQMKLRAYRKASRQWFKQSASKAFRSWKQFAEKSKQKKKEEMIRMQNQRAMSHWQNGVLGRVYQIWKHFAKSQQGNMKKYRAAASHFNSSSKRGRFIRWRDKARRRMILRRRLVMVYMAAVPIETHNTKDQKMNAYLAIRHFEQLRKRRIFRRLRLAYLHRMEKRHAAVEFFVKRMMAGTGLECLKAWKDYIVMKKLKAAMKANGFAFWERISKKNALTKMHERVLRRKTLETNFRRALNMFTNSLCQRMFASWLHFHEMHQQKLALMAKVQKYWTNQAIGRGVMQWRIWVRQQKDMRELIRKARLQFNGCIRHKIFQAWKRWLSARSGSKAAIAARMSNRRAAKTMYRWKEYVVEVKQLRLEQIAVWDKKAWAAMKFQSAYRARVARREADDWGTFRSWAIIKVQNRFRQKMAWRKKNAKFRHQLLRDFKRAEYECELMALEEEISEFLRMEFNAARRIQNAFLKYSGRYAAWVARNARMAEFGIIKKIEHEEIVDNHYVQEQLRKERRLLEEVTAVDIQKIGRAYLARCLFVIMQHDHRLKLAATRMQSNYRARLGRKRAAAFRRHFATRVETKKRRRQAAKLLRSIPAANWKARREQEEATQNLEDLGLDAKSYEVRPKTVWDEIKSDFLSIKQSTQIEYRAFREGKLDETLRAKIRFEQTAILRNKKMPKKGDSVRIMVKNHEHYGQTADILQVDATLPGQELALVRIDGTQELLFFPVYQPETATQAKFLTFIKVDPMFRKWKMVPKEVRENKGPLQIAAEEFRIERRDRLASRKIQTAYRRYAVLKSYEDKVVQWRIKTAEKKAKVLRLLRKAGLDSAKMGRWLVRMKFIRQEEMPNMPDRLLLPPSILRIMEAHLKRRLLRRELKNKYLKRKQFVQSAYKVLKAHPNRDVPVPFRRLKSSRKKRVERTLWLLERTTRPVSRKILRFVARRGNSRNKLIQMVNWFGEALQKGEPPHKSKWKYNSSYITQAWAGEYHFKQFVGSKHVGGNGVGVFHGLWQKWKQIPMDDGSFTFIDGPFTIGCEPQTLCVTEGGYSTQSIRTSGGTLPHECMWKRNAFSIDHVDNESAWTNVFTMNHLTLGDTANYSCEIHDGRYPGSAPIFSKSAPVIVNPAMVVGTQPKGVIITSTAPLWLSVKVHNGTPPFSYRWIKDGKEVPLKARMATYHVPAASIYDSGLYHCRITDSGGTVIKSEDATVVVNKVLRVSTQPEDFVVTEGDESWLTVLVEDGTPPYTYSWKKDGKFLEDSDNFKHLLSPCMLANDGMYSCVINDQGNVKVETKLAKMRVLGPLLVSVRNAKDLHEVEWKSNPYVDLKMNTQLLSTSTIRHTLDPEWNEDFSLNVVDDTLDVLKLKVLHRYEGESVIPEFLGMLHIPIQELSHGREVCQTWKLRNDQNHEEKYLNDGKGYGSIEMKVKWKQKDGFVERPLTAETSEESIAEAVAKSLKSVVDDVCQDANENGEPTLGKEMTEKDVAAYVAEFRETYDFSILDPNRLPKEKEAVPLDMVNEDVRSCLASLVDTLCDDNPDNAQQTAEKIGEVKQMVEDDVLACIVRFRDDFDFSIFENKGPSLAPPLDIISAPGTAEVLVLNGVDKTAGLSDDDSLASRVQHALHIPQDDAIEKTLVENRVVVLDADAFEIKTILEELVVKVESKKVPVCEWKALTASHYHMVASQFLPQIETTLFSGASVFGYVDEDFRIWTELVRILHEADEKVAHLKLMGMGDEGLDDGNPALESVEYECIKQLSLFYMEEYQKFRLTLPFNDGIHRLGTTELVGDTLPRLIKCNDLKSHTKLRLVGKPFASYVPRLLAYVKQGVFGVHSERTFYPKYAAIDGDIQNGCFDGEVIVR
jgi:hypothetical protein